MGKYRPALGALTGGGTGALDKIPVAQISDGDAAKVTLSTGSYDFHYDASSTDSENSPFRIIPDDNVSGTGAWHLVGTTARVGALVRLSANQSIGTTSVTPIDWETEIHDDASFWEGVTNPSRFTIPVGVTRVKVSSCVHFATSAVNNRLLLIYKNGATFQGQPVLTITPISFQTDMFVSSPTIDCVATDYFESAVYQDTGGNLNVENVASTWFAIDAVGFA